MMSFLKFYKLFPEFWDGRRYFVRKLNDVGILTSRSSIFGKNLSTFLVVDLYIISISDLFSIFRLFVVGLKIHLRPR